MKNIAILGSTGSIGRNALDVVAKYADKFKVVSLTAGRNLELLKTQIEFYKPYMAAVLDDEHAEALRDMLDPSCQVKIVSGETGYQAAATIEEADMVLSAMVGAAGLLPTMAAIDAGKDVALANKETMVIAGQLVMEKARARGISILPVDSEHSAVFQCLESRRQNAVRRIILTASGGPFLRLSAEEMKSVKPEQALRHPNWTMGKKISIDSATMMNKGLEIIEARWLFDVPFEKIDVVIHPQSIVHSMVEYEDGAVLAQLGKPDMRIPIAYALSYPERIKSDGPFLDFSSMTALSFSKPDEARFPCLNLARRAGKTGAAMPAVMNAANEIAVDQYLDGAIGFTDIARIVADVMEKIPIAKAWPSIHDLLAADREARKKTKDYIKESVK